MPVRLWESGPQDLSATGRLDMLHGIVHGVPQLFAKLAARGMFSGEKSKSCSIGMNLLAYIL